jgi:hypothetical protein
MDGIPEIDEQTMHDLAKSHGQSLKNVIHTKWFFNLCVAYQNGDIEL